MLSMGAVVCSWAEARSGAKKRPMQRAMRAKGIICLERVIEWSGGGAK